MNDKIISLEIKLEEKRQEIELQKIEYLKLVRRNPKSKKTWDFYLTYTYHCANIMKWHRERFTREALLFFYFKFLRNNPCIGIK